MRDVQAAKVAVRHLDSWLVSEVGRVHGEQLCRLCSLLRQDGRSEMAVAEAEATSTGEAILHARASRDSQSEPHASLSLELRCTTKFAWRGLSRTKAGPRKYTKYTTPLLPVQAPTACAVLSFSRSSQSRLSRSCTERPSGWARWKLTVPKATAGRFV